MNNLIVRVENINGVLVTTSNRVAEELGVEHKNLIRKIDEYVEKFGSSTLSHEFYIESIFDNRGRRYRNYLITKKGIAQLVGGYSSAVEKAFDLNVAYINRFEEMEKQLQNQFKIPTSFADALKLAYEQQLLIEQQKPKVEYHDKVLKPDKLITTTQIAKDLGMSAARLHIILHEQGIIYRKSKTWFFYKEHQNKVPEYADYVIGEKFQQLKWTELGRKWIINIVTKVLEGEISNE